MINNLIELQNKIKSNDKLLVTRLGNVETTALLYTNGIYKEMYTNAGFYVDEGDEQKIFKEWKSKYVKGLINSDVILDVFTCPSFQIVGDLMIRLNLWKPSLPYIENPKWWIDCVINNMEGTIGIISYFKEDIEKQLKVLDKVWAINLNKNFIIIKSYNTIEGNSKHKNWLETYEDLESRVSKHKEVKNWLVSSGSYGLPICDYLYNNIDNSKVFYVGGLLQLLFGLKGSRWDNRKEVNINYNKYWKYPKEKPINANKVEGWCYGKTE